MPQEAQEVALQADVGSLGIRGLQALMPVLSALSADDVAPTAVVQLENLGSMLPISGPIAAKLPDYLQRCSSRRLERLGLTVGWRKGDTAAIMSETAGGQAVALAAVYMVNIHGARACANILRSLSQRLLPSAAVVCSTAQLLRAAQLLSDKLAIVGVGNLLARQVERIHEVYNQLGIPPPKDLLDEFSPETQVEVLEAFSRALREEETITRISGTSGMGYIMAIASGMFPDDTVVTIEKFITHRGHRQSIFLDIAKAWDAGAPTMIRIQRTINPEYIKKEFSQGSGMPRLRYLNFRWQGWLADYISLRLRSHGGQLSSKVLKAIGQLLIAMGLSCHVSWPAIPGKENVRSAPTTHLFGDFPQATLLVRCESMLGTAIPGPTAPSPKVALGNLRDFFVKAIEEQKMPCTCGRLFHDRYQLHCSACMQWAALVESITNALPPLLIVPGENATWNMDPIHMDFPQLTQSLTGGDPDTLGVSVSEILQRIMGPGRGWFLISAPSGTILPGPLSHLMNQPLKNVFFELIEGQPLYQGRYYTDVRGTDGHVFTCEIPRQPLETIIPSAEGVHSGLLVTVEENFHMLRLQVSATCSGLTSEIPLAESLRAALVQVFTTKCDHPPSQPLDDDFLPFVQTTSAVTSGGIFDTAHPNNIIRIVQTKGNATAQFLALRAKDGAIFCRDCCLTCAVKQAKDRGFGAIIVC